MTMTSPIRSRLLLAVLVLAACAAAPHSARSQAPATPPATQPPDSGGPTVDNGPIVIPRKKESNEPPAPAAPEQPKVKNPNGETYSLRVDVPIVNLDVSVILDKTHQFVPGLKAPNFLVLEDGVEQKVDTVRIAQTPITAVMLLEFAANSWYVINDLQIVAESLRSLTIPTFSDTDMFDALYETLDRTSRIQGRKYIILIGTGRDTFSKLTLDKMRAKIKASPNVTIFTIGTGALLNQFNTGGGIGELNYLQAQNQLKTFAAMTGGLSFSPIFQGELPDDFAQINNSIRNQYILTYRPSNPKNDGSYRKIKVVLVDNEGHPLQMQDEKGKPLKYSVIARDGYNAKLPVQ